MSKWVGGGTTDEEKSWLWGDKGELSLSLMLGLRFLRGRQGRWVGSSAEKSDLEGRIRNVHAQTCGRGSWEWMSLRSSCMN